MGFGIGWILVIGIIVFAISRGKKRKMCAVHQDGSQTAMERLNERFINNEIDESTYKNMKSVIRK
jgi:uncharacterized membrane protein